MMRRSWQISLLALYMPLWLLAFLPVAMFGLFGGRGSFFEFDLLNWSAGMWIFAALLILPPLAFTWAAITLIADYLSKLGRNASN